MKDGQTQERTEFTKSIEGYNKCTVVGFNRDGRDGKEDKGRDYVVFTVENEKFNKSTPLSSKDDELTSYFQGICESLLKACGKQVPPIGTPIAQLWNQVQSCVGSVCSVLMVPQEEANEKGYYNSFPYGLGKDQPIFDTPARAGVEWNRIRPGGESAPTPTPSEGGSENGVNDSLPF